MRISTDRLLLREFAPEDARAVCDVMSDPEVVRYTEYELFTPERAGEFIRWAGREAESAPRRVYALALALPADAGFIGLCSLIVRDLEQRAADIGFIVGRRHWRRGYATDAARALVNFGFERLGLHRIFAECDPENGGSARVLERIGMRREGHLRECRWQKEAWQDRLVYAILDHEWSI